MSITVPQPGAGTRRRRSALGDFAADRTRDVFAALVNDFRSSYQGSVKALLGEDRDSLYGPDAANLVRLAEDVFGGLELSEADFPLFVELLTLVRRTDLLTKYRVNHLSYGIYDDHFANAGSPSALRPERRPVAARRHWDFLGHRIGFPIGVAASGLTTNSVAVTRLLRSGYNVVTYKTVRSTKRDPLQPPNWVISNDLSPKDLAARAAGVPIQIGNTSIRDALSNPHVSTANSFGVPSSDPTVWIDDLAAAVDAASGDQLVICSVLGEDYSANPSVEGLVADFVKVAQLARSTRVAAIELNLSCPNTLDRDGKPATPLCFEEDLTVEIVSGVRAALGTDVRIGIKLAHMEPERLTALMDRCVARVDFVTGINTVQAPIQRDHVEVFPGRETAGLGGHVLSELALEFVSTLDGYRQRSGHDFAIIGVGGVTDVASFEALYLAGADVVQSVSGVFVNTFLALDCVRELGPSLPLNPVNTLKSKLVELTRDVPTPMWVYASEIDQPATLTFGLLDELVSEGELVEVDTDPFREFVRAGASSSLGLV